MCGRYALYGPPPRIQEQFGIEGGLDFGPRYNIAPTTRVLIIRAGPGGRRAANFYRWGLIPGWAKDPGIGAKLNNARGETVAEKPAFRSAFKRWRCLIPANGFYEWRAVQEAGRTIKQPFYIRSTAEDELFAFAGLTEMWKSPEGEEIHTCCIITTEANAVMAPIHERMPVILPRAHYATWLDSSNTNVGELQGLLLPAEPRTMRAYPVSRAVNVSRTDTPALIVPT